MSFISLLAMAILEKKEFFWYNNILVKERGALYESIICCE